MNLLRSEASGGQRSHPMLLGTIFQEGEMPELQRSFYCRDRSLMELLL
jgi:hypothetical protein